MSQVRFLTHHNAGQLPDILALDHERVRRVPLKVVLLKDHQGKGSGGSWSGQKLV